MLERASKAFFHLVAGSATLKTLASRYGMRRDTSFARRFIAGETIEQAVAAARAVESGGLHLTLDYLGESVSTLAEADAATRAYLGVVDAVIATGIERNLSLKLTQLGLDVDEASAVDNMRKILARSDPAGFFIRIDMESSAYTDLTLRVFETLWQQGHRNIGVVLQADLRRTEADVRRVNALGARIRLVKGAYREPKEVAFVHKGEVDDAYGRLVRLLLAEGRDPAIATHDPAMITLTRQWAAEHHVPPDRFEFQMLYGIRRDLQSALVSAGYRVRVYIPFGREWFPYFMRRLGEHPANVAFVAKAIFKEERNQ
jgi:proline dehydrogenase